MECPKCSRPVGQNVEQCATCGYLIPAEWWQRKQQAKAPPAPPTPPPQTATPTRPASTEAPPPPRSPLMRNAIPIINARSDDDDDQPKTFWARLNKFLVAGAAMMLIGLLFSRSPSMNYKSVSERELYEGSVSPGPVEVKRPIRAQELHVYRVLTEDGIIYSDKRVDKDPVKPIFGEPKTYKKKENMEVWYPAAASPCLWYAAEGIAYPAVTSVEGIYRTEPMPEDLEPLVRDANNGEGCKALHVVLVNSRAGSATGLWLFWIGGFVFVAGLVKVWMA